MISSGGDVGEPVFVRGGAGFRCRSFRPGYQAERPGQESRHLAPGYYRVGAVPVLSAAGCDAGGRQRVDRLGVAMSVGVGEPGRRSVLEVKGAGQEGCHLPSCYRLVGAVPRRGGAASLGDIQLGQAFYVGCPPDRGVQVGEPCGGRRGGLVCGPDEPYPHHPAQERFVGADPPFAALGAFQDPLAGQGVDGRLVSPAGVVKTVLRRRADGQHQ